MIRLLLPLLFFASAAPAFTLNSSTSSNFKGWADPHVRFLLNLSNCPASVDVRGIVGDAVDVWNNVATSKLELSVDGDTTLTTYDNPITVECDTNYGNGDAAIANGSPGAAVVYPSSGDYITKGIMYLNASGGNANISRLSRTLVAITLAHEFGHLLGLGHSQDTSALMYYDASAKSHLALAQDDIDAVTYLYPRNELGGDGIAGCGRVDSGGGAGRPLLVLMLFMLPLALLIKMRQSRIV